MSGDVAINGASAVLQADTGASVVLDTLTLAVGTLQADGPVDVNGLLTWTGPTSNSYESVISGPGVVNVYGGMLLDSYFSSVFNTR